MLRSALVALAIATAAASRAAAVSLPNEPCVREDDRGIELHGPKRHLPSPQGVSFRDDDRRHDSRGPRGHDEPGRGSHDFDHDGGWHGHEGDGHHGGGDCTPVPEPSALALLGAAAGALGAARHRTRRAG